MQRLAISGVVLTRQAGCDNDWRRLLQIGDVSRPSFGPRGHYVIADARPPGPARIRVHLGHNPARASPSVSYHNFNYSRTSSKHNLFERLLKQWKAHIRLLLLMICTKNQAHNINRRRVFGPAFPYILTASSPAHAQSSCTGC
jgi:hypothetical protein